MSDDPPEKNDEKPVVITWKVDPERKDDRQRRREIRKDYRALINDMVSPDVHQELIRAESNGVHQRLDNIDNLYVKVEHAREAVLDSEALKIASKYATVQAQSLKTHAVVFDPHIFAEKLVTFMSDRTDESEQTVSKLDWHKLGCTVAGYFRRAPSVNFMYGSLAVDANIAARSERKQRERSRESAPQVTPQQVGKEQDSPEEATTKEVQRVDRELKDVLRKNEGDVSYWDFVINPCSFSQTVENIFHLSFLIKDGRYEIYEEDDLPWIRNAPVVENGDERATERKQTIVAITMPLWEKLKEVFEITEPLIPTRPGCEDGNRRR